MGARALLLCAVGLVILVPAASGIPVVGTPDQPELYDASGDVTYSNLYQGPRDRSFLDINASWMDVDEAAQTFTLHLRVESTEGLTAARETSAVSCNMEAVLAAENETTGIISWSFAHLGPPAPAPRPSSMVRLEDNAGTSRSVDAEFQTIDGTPGFHQWTVRRADVLGMPATNILDLEGYCNERYGGTATAAFPLIVNIDRAASDSDYSLFTGRSTTADGGSGDDLESLNPGSAPAGSSETTSNTHSSGFVVVAALAALGVATTFMAKRRQ